MDEEETRTLLRQEDIKSAGQSNADQLQAMQGAQIAELGLSSISSSSLEFQI